MVASYLGNLLDSLKGPAPYLYLITTKSKFSFLIQRSRTVVLTQNLTINPINKTKSFNKAISFTFLAIFHDQKDLHNLEDTAFECMFKRTSHVQEMGI